MTDSTSLFMSWHEAAAFLSVHTRTLARWHSEGIGPPRIKVRRQILYRKASLIDWLESQEQPACRG